MPDIIIKLKWYSEVLISYTGGYNNFYTYNGIWTSAGQGSLAWKQAIAGEKWLVWSGVFKFA